MRKGLSRWLARLPPVHNEGAATAEFAVVLPSVIAITGGVADAYPSGCGIHGLPKCRNGIRA